VLDDVNEIVFNDRPVSKPLSEGRLVVLTAAKVLKPAAVLNALRVDLCLRPSISFLSSLVFGCRFIILSRMSPKDERLATDAAAGST
jgi:hypothetical protein